MNENTLTIEEWKKKAQRRNHHKEKDFMNQLIKAAWLFNHPCIHIENYCGNRINAPCQKCGHKNLVVCHKVNNLHATGHFDILGIAWALETKTKLNKNKESPKLSINQCSMANLYQKYHIPHFAANEDNEIEALKFLQSLP